MPRVVTLDELTERAVELVQSVAETREPLVIEEGSRPLAVLAPQVATETSGMSAMELPRWHHWVQDVRAAFPEVVAGERRGSEKPAETVVDKSLLGFDPGTGTVGSAGGREFLTSELQRLGVPISDVELVDTVYAAVLELCEAKHLVYEEDLRVLAHEAIAEAPQRLRLLAMTVQCTTGIGAMAEVTLELSHGPAMRRAHGDGPLHAAFTAIEKLVGVEPEVENFSVVSATRGQDAIAEATIQLLHEGLSVAGRGASTDAVEAGVHAYLNALNFLLEARRADLMGPQTS